MFDPELYYTINNCSQHILYPALFLTCYLVPGNLKKPLLSWDCGSFLDKAGTPQNGGTVFDGMYGIE